MDFADLKNLAARTRTSPGSMPSIASAIRATKLIPPRAYSPTRAGSRACTDGHQDFGGNRIAPAFDLTLGSSDRRDI
jgi:hypothetical protein